jgi:hypothetical protein
MTDEHEPLGTSQHEQVLIATLPELDYWMTRLEASGWQLRDAVAAVGANPNDVQQYLRSPKPGPIGQ